MFLNISIYKTTLSRSFGSSIKNILSFRSNLNSKNIYLWKHGKRFSTKFEMKAPKDKIIEIPSRTRTSLTIDANKGKYQVITYTRLWSLAKPEKWKLTAAIGFLLISSTITMGIPFALGKIIDTIYSDDPKQMKTNLDHLALMLLTVFVIGAACNFGRVYFMSVAGVRITQNLRQKLFSSILRQDVAFFDKSKTGELINRLSADTTIVSQTVTANISDGLRSTVMVTAGVSMMFYMSPQLAGVGLVIVPPVAIMAVFYGRFVRKITTNVQDSLASATSVAQERVANIRTVKSFSNEPLEIRAYNSKLDDVLELQYKEALARGFFFGMAGFAGNAIILTVLYYGGVMVSSQSISVGNLSSFLLYAAYIGISIGGLSTFYSDLNKGLGACSRLWEIINRTPELKEGKIDLPISLKGNIGFEKIRFRYPARPDVPVLEDFSLRIPAGKITALVGASGSGKSSVAALLLRLYDPEEGSVTIDGISIEDIHRQSLHSQIGYVAQEPVLFSCSVRENILYGTEYPAEVPEERLIQVTQEANCFHFITKDFPDGFNTLVGERGVMLSGGQKQRIAIARALIKNPKILVLDEATSALDTENERLVQEALEKIMKDRTVLTIAHRLSTIRNADQIAVLDRGKVVELGTYDDLVNKKKGPFLKLMTHQSLL